MRWAGHAACRRQINACSILGRKTLVGIVGFQAGMKHKTFRECCTQHHSMATCQPYNHLPNRIPFVTSLAGLFATTHLPPSRLIPNVRFFLQSLPLLQRQSLVSTSGRLEYYDVVWGLTKVLLKEKGLVAVSRLRRRYLVEVRNLNDRVSDIQGCQNCLSYGLLWHICAFIV